MTKIALYLFIGRLIIWAIQNFPLTQLPAIGVLFEEEKFLGKLVRCDFCLGFWVFLGLAFASEITLVGELIQVPILSEILTGLAASFIMHIFMIGLKEKFSVLEIK